MAGRRVMGDVEKVVARFKNGQVLKGHVKDFETGTEVVTVEDPETRAAHEISIDELKAIFFVKTFKGRGEYVEKKAFGIRKNPGRKVFVKFKDNETLVGYIDGDIPWAKGFSLEKEGNKAKGFFLVPVDSDSNNIKVYVVGTSIQDVTIMMV
jgi:small nuclear ribonucleoprotein (snRNP)-like protein